MILLCYQYGFMIGEEPQRLVPVELMIIKDIHLVSSEPPAPISRPKVLTGRPPPVVASQMEAVEAPDPMLVETITEPRLNLPNSLTKNSPATPRKTKTAPFGSLAGKAEVTTATTAVDPLVPDAAPALAFEPMEGLMAANTSKQPVPVRSSQVLIPSEPLKKSADDTHPEPTTMASLEPSILAPESEPAALKFERPPTIPFPGSDNGGSFLLLLDTSGSVRGDPLRGIKASAAEFISLMGPKDRVALMTFDDTPRLINNFISIPFEKDMLKIRLRHLQTTGKLTVLNDSLLEASQILNSEDSENLHVVLFSDGKDEGSRSSFDQVVNALKAAKISVLAVGFTRVEQKYLDILRRIADETGGVFVQTPEFQDILTLYKSASQETKPATEISETKVGAFFIKSSPTGAQIYLNGEYIGTAPKRVQLPVGKYHLQLRYEGYQEWQAPIELSDPREIPITVKLEPIQS